MIIVKLFVLTFFFLVVVANSSEYCKVCLNHTLCKYPVPGPGYACTGYDASALLTRDDIINLVSRINERRNFVALGLSKLLPKAANMRKISWSEDLAWSAQRWVDQCDVAVRPDKHDLCRNLEDKSVGQSIATIFGPSPGLSAKSFVDIWFMQTLDYSGNVSFYNESQDANTKYFTQLIWAETDSVGCGKARFHIKYRMVIERLVCNFAPSGNIHGKPVYAVGIPATQCPENWIPDDTYIGLCNYQYLSKIYSHQKPLMTNLLRIVDLANNSAKQEIDPLKNYPKQSNIDVDENDDHRHHKSRHVVNNSQVDMSHFLQRPMLWNSLNDSRNFLVHHYQPEKGQPRVYHGHNHRGNFVPPYTTTDEQNFRRFDILTQPSLPPPETHTSENYRKFNQHNQCTRRSRIINNCNSPVPCLTDKCTRGQNQGCGVTPSCISNVQTPYVFPHNQCPYSPPTTCPPPTSRNPCCEVTCHCPCHVTTLSPCCPNIAKAEEKSRKSDELHYYDLFPNLALRAGDLTSENLPDKGNTPTARKMWLLRNIPRSNDKHKILKHKRREYQLSKNYEQVKHELELPNYMEEERDYINSSFDSRKIQKREPKDKITYNPFWQMNKQETEHSIIMKSLQYTTLRNKKNRNTWRTAHNSVTDVTTTESITIEQKNFERYDNQDNIDSQHSTDKYLSFEELMHLRKLNFGEYNARRFGGRRAPGQNTTPSTGPGVHQRSGSGASRISSPGALPLSGPGASPGTRSRSIKGKPTLPSLGLRRSDKDEGELPQNYSVVATIRPKKYCTRRLTCTWTVYTATASDGSFINQGPPGGGGSRTPPGYVEGCSRTSTCTRDFMNRNKISTVPMSTLAPGQEIEDEDYCERRSLDVKKRNSNKEPETEQIVKRHKIDKTLNFVNKSSNPEELVYGKKNICSYAVEDIIRMKRNVNKDMLKCNHCIRKTEGPFKNPLMSYGDLYYLVLNKLTKTWEVDKKVKKCSKCLCNSSDSKWNNIISIMFLVLTNSLNFIVKIYFHYT